MKRLIVAIVGVVVIAASYLGQAQPGKLASLIQAGNKKAALDMIRAGADVNEAQPDGTRPIHWAVYRVDYELLDALIAKKARANVTNELGATPLSEAVEQGDARMVKSLLDAGSGPEAPNGDGQTALMLAIKSGNLALVQMLITAGANVNVVEKAQNQTPLMWAAATNQNAEEIVKLLIAKGAKVNVRAKSVDWPAQMTSEPRAQYHAYGGLTPLLYASRNGCYGCVEALVAAGADVNLPNNLEGLTPLMLAIENNHNDVAKYLLDHGANAKVWDVYGRTALYIAVDKKPAGGGGGAGAAPGGGRGGAGGGAGAGAGRGGAPGGAGAAGGRGGAPGGAPALGAAGAAPAGAPAVAAAGQGAPGGRGGAGAPVAAAGQGAPGGRGAGAGGAGGRGGAPGGAGGGRGGGGGAAGGGNRQGPAFSSMELINALLAAGVDPNAHLVARRPEVGSGGRFNDPMLSTGTTPLYRATMNNPPDMEVIKVLLDKGASPNIFDMGITPFLLAAGVEAGGLGGARGGGGGGGAAVNTALLDLFLAHGADINTKVTGRLSYSMRLSRSAGWPNIEGLTALHAAVGSGRTDMVRYLLDHGARVDIADASGRTAMDVAKGVPTKPAPANFGTANIPAPVIPGQDKDVALAASGSNSAGAGRGGAARVASPEIQAMLQAAAQKK